MNKFDVVIEAGERKRPANLVSLPVQTQHGDPIHGVEVLSRGAAIPTEFAPQSQDGRQHIHFIVDGLNAGETRTFEVRLLESGETASTDFHNAVHVYDLGDHVDFKINDDLFTTYHYRPGLARPCFYPIIASGGLAVTRGWPMEEGIPGETTDHSHHRGLWVAHGEVNGIDNWSEAKNHGWTRHGSFENLLSSPLRAHLDARSTWQAPDGAEVLQESRQATVFELPGGIRILDIDLHLTATRGAVTFGDTKEGGMCSVRVATSMDASRGGRIEDADGRVGESQAWGKRSNWCDYSGGVRGETVGIAIMDHPDNFRHPTYWHVRDYGLMTANPFGSATFTGKPEENGSHTLAEGETLKFRYRVVIHHGSASQADIAGHYANWTNPPLITAP